MPKRIHHKFESKQNSENIINELKVTRKQLCLLLEDQNKKRSSQVRPVYANYGS